MDNNIQRLPKQVDIDRSSQGELGNQRPPQGDGFEKTGVLGGFFDQHRGKLTAVAAFGAAVVGEFVTGGLGTVAVGAIGAFAGAAGIRHDTRRSTKKATVADDRPKIAGKQRNTAAAVQTPGRQRPIVSRRDQLTAKEINESPNYPKAGVPRNSGGGNSPENR